MLTLEQKRALAAQHRGVVYDARSNRFYAQIMVRGAREYLGSFEKVEDAAAAYNAARESEPITRAPAHGDRTAEQAYQIMLETAERNEKGFLLPGGAFITLSHGQTFVLKDTEHRWAKPGAGRKRWMFWVWEGPCLLCGADFTFKTRVGVKHVHGLTRNCEEHRGQRGEPWSLAPDWQRKLALVAAEETRADDARVAAYQKAKAAGGDLV